MTTAIEKSPHRMRQIDDILPGHTGVSITNTCGIIVYASKAFCDECGYSEEELPGKNHSIPRSGIHSNSYHVFLWNTISSGQPDEHHHGRCSPCTVDMEAELKRKKVWRCNRPRIIDIGFIQIPRWHHRVRYRHRRPVGVPW